MHLNNLRFPAVMHSIPGNLTSADGITWTLRTPVTYGKLDGVTHDNNTFVAVGAGGTILQSDPVK